ncbi:MAG: NAD(P)/FAD-dependent oxidoreductase [Spirochaetales bacterium]|nr:NAD(P)/FAD-dependent oxidoreductase [Spirochaetales bacterium]
MKQEIYDIVIVGAGLGGLSAGAKCAKAGKSVLLIDKEPQSGGMAANFTRKGFEFDISLNSFGVNSEIRKFFHDVGIEDRIELVSPESGQRYINTFDNTDINLSARKSSYAENISQYLGIDKKPLDKYMEYLKRTGRNLDINSIKCNGLAKITEAIKTLLRDPSCILHINSKKSAEDLIGSFITMNGATGRKLRHILLSRFNCFDEDYKTLSPFFFSIAMDTLLADDESGTNGEYYIKGGSGKLSSTLADAITACSAGNRILTRHKAVKLIADDHNRICGVDYIDMKSKRHQTVFAKKVIVNAPIPHAVSQLLPTQCIRIRKHARRYRLSQRSSVQIYIALKNSIQSAYNTALVDPAVRHCPETGVSITNYSAIDSGLAQPAATIRFYDHISSWAGMDESGNWKKHDRYTEQKAKWAEYYIDLCDRVVPKLKENALYYNVATPVSIQRHINSPYGSYYGYSQTAGQTGMDRMDLKSCVPNLFFAGAYTKPGLGVTCTLLSGDKCADLVLAELDRK